MSEPAGSDGGEGGVAAGGGSAAAGGGGGGGSGGTHGERWRRQWLVLKDDGLLLCYRKPKESTPAEVLFSAEFEALP